MSATVGSDRTTSYLIPPGTEIETPGEGPACELGPLAGKSLLVILRVEEIIEQESLLVSVGGSADGKDWGTKPLFYYPERFHRSVTPAALDLSQRPEINFLQARWAVNRWGRGYPRPYFKIALEIQGLQAG